MGSFNCWSTKCLFTLSTLKHVQEVCGIAVYDDYDYFASCVLNLYMSVILCFDSPSSV